MLQVQLPASRADASGCAAASSLEDWHLEAAVGLLLSGLGDTLRTAVAAVLDADLLTCYPHKGWAGLLNEDGNGKAGSALLSPTRLWGDLTMSPPGHDREKASAKAPPPLPPGLCSVDSPWDMGYVSLVRSSQELALAKHE
eukprot:SM000176S03151  [mRNA]  locus=s176:214679:215418:- [translate_table: standard]